MFIKNFQLKDVGPFDDIKFEFDEHVNVFVGPNNSGKSCALSSLAEVCVYPFGIPSKFLRENGNAQFSIELGGRKKSSENSRSGRIPIDMSLTNTSMEEAHKYGMFLKNLGYTAFVPCLRWGTESRATGPTTVAQQSKLNEKKKERTTYLEELNNRHQFTSPKDYDTKFKLAKEVDAELNKRRSLFEPNSSLASDKAIVQSIIDLDYKAYRQNASSIHKLIKQIFIIASEITEGYPIEFCGVGEDRLGFYLKFKTPDGTMPLHALSQGTQSIIHWIAHLLIGLANYYDFPNEPENCAGILIVDEIDAHLHPSWQRRIIPTLSKHFKNLQIFCSTHSPLMLAGLRQGQIILLKRNKKGGATYSKNSDDIIGWSGDEILRNILELESSTDLETEEKIKRLVSIREKSKLSSHEKAELFQLRNQVGNILLSAPTDLKLDNAGEKINLFLKEVGTKKIGLKKRAKK